MVYIGILAGGDNVLFKNNLPIQFMTLGDKPLIVHTIEQFVVNAKHEKIIVVVPEKYIDYTEDLLEKHFDMSNIHIIEGGTNKNNSINKIADFINVEYGVNDDDTLLCHDAIRPFITQKIINDNIELAKNYKVINTVVPSVETVICSENGNTVQSIPRTTTVFIEQTPQTFNLATIKEISAKIPKDILEKEIDLARLFVNNGYEVQLVIGEFSNIKLVTEYDLEVSSALIRERSRNV